MAKTDYTTILIVLLVAVSCALLYCCFVSKSAPSSTTHPRESYTDYEQMMATDDNEQSQHHNAPEHSGYQASATGPPSAAEPIGQNETHQTLDAGSVSNTNASVPKDCFPKDQLTPKDLLPTDTNSTWAQVNPAGQGNIGDNNLLTAGHHVGINTVGQTLRNANLQLRSEPPNPQMKVSPWMQSTIEPDANRRPMEIK